MLTEGVIHMRAFVFPGQGSQKVGMGVELAEASAVQPFAYMQFVFITLIGIFAFGESLSLVVLIGVALVMAAGVYALWSERTARNG